MVVQTVPEPTSSSPPLFSHCQGNTQLIQDLLIKDDAPLIQTRCHSNTSPKKDLFKEDMGRRKKPRDEYMIRSTLAEENGKDKEI